MRCIAISIIMACILFALIPINASAATPVEPPHYFAIVAGISHYEGSDLRLSYAANDAEQVANALKLGATRLFGAAGVQVTLLTTKEDVKAMLPTKKNIKQVFETVAKKARPDDILVVYLAGHGVTLPQGQDTYCFLTSEARSTADLADPGVRNLTAITSEELRHWLSNITAQKQVVILDTCAAGAVAGNLSDSREVIGDQQRAIARLRDRRGLHILMGCAANARSYEANQYGQGLLTYALLKGMKGAALRQEEFLDITTLFSYVADSVPVLAKNVGGMQRPLCSISPGGSFDIGQLTADDRQQIPLAAPRPIVLRPLLINPEVVGDPLYLSRAVLLRLRDVALSSDTSPYVYVDAADYPGAYALKGIYTIKGAVVHANIRLWRDSTMVGSIELDGDMQNPENFASNLVSALCQELLAKVEK